MAPRPKERTFVYRPGIDGTRAIAVLGVVLYHAGFGPPAGFVGVDVFFVISGFLITSLLELELTNTGGIDLAAFYARRARRLLPALGLVLVVTVVACFFILSPYGELASALQSVAASIVFGANIYFQHTTGDYFGPDVNHLPLLHLWSLGVEEQYYLLWPLALLLARRLPLNARRAVFALCALASLAFAEWSLYQGSQAAFYAMPSRWWELSLGAMVAWLPAPDKRAGRWESWVGGGGVISAMAIPTHHFPGLGALPATLGTALLLHASITEGGAWTFLSVRPMLLIGRVSYPFYLWHWPLLVFAAAAFPGELPAVTRAALALAAFLLGLGTWEFLESPLRSMAMPLPRHLVRATLATCVASAVLFIRVAAVAGKTSASDPNPLAGLDAPSNFPRCHSQFASPARLPDETACALGGTDPPRVAIWGDSHALALGPFAKAVALREGKTAIAYSRDACPPAVGYDTGQEGILAARCKDFNAAAIGRAETMDTVILAARWPLHDERDFAADLTATVDRLSSHVRRVFIIGPTPVLPANAPYCLHHDALHSCDVAREEFVAQSAAVRNLLSSLPATHPKVTYVEPLDFFCDDLVCPGARNGVALYWDNHHIASTAAAAFGKAYLAGWADRDL